MRSLLVILALLTAATPPAAAFAQDRPAAGRQAPLSRVLASIARSTPGRHINTTMGDQGGRPVYFVQWQLPEGRVVVFVVDAESGQVIGRQGG